MKTLFTLLLLAVATTAMAQQKPIVEKIKPKGNYAPTTYTPVVTVTGGTLVLFSGHVALDEKGQMVGGESMEAQTRQVFENLKRALASVNADFSHVVKITYYVVGLNPETQNIIRTVRKQYITDQMAPASTLLGVQALSDSFLIEIEITAVIPTPKP